MIGATKRRNRDDRLAAVRPFPGGEFFKRRDALILEVLADDEHYRTAAGVDRHQDASGAAVIAELHRMGDVADTDVALRRGDDLARLDAAATLKQFAVEARFLEVSNSIRHELGLIDRHRHRVDHAAGLVLGPCSTRYDGGTAAGDDLQGRTSRKMSCHHE